jgi:hypothetical protein
MLTELQEEAGVPPELVRNMQGDLAPEKGLSLNLCVRQVEHLGTAGAVLALDETGVTKREQ